MADPRDPDRQLALLHVRAHVRDDVRALWLLDERLGDIVATTTQPLIGQMRLTWWHDQLCALGSGRPSAEPLLVALDGVVGRHDVNGAAMARLVEGWEELLEATPDLDLFARLRGDGLFALSAAVLGGSPGAGCGKVWALADHARRHGNTVAGAHMIPVDRTMVRPLRILTSLALSDVREQGTRARRPRLALLRALIA